MISGSAANLFDPGSFAWQYGPRFEWAIFSSGRNRAILKSANSRQREALLQYEKSVLGAIGEVESQPAQLQSTHQQFANLSSTVDARMESVHLSDELYCAGSSDLLRRLVEEQ